MVLLVAGLLLAAAPSIVMMRAPAGALEAAEVAGKCGRSSCAAEENGEGRAKGCANSGGSMGRDSDESGLAAADDCCGVEADLCLAEMPLPPPELFLEEEEPDLDLDLVDLISSFDLALAPS